MNINVLYEDENFLAVDKPSGVLVDEVLEKFPGFILAHRLDRETSGVLVLAKNEEAHLIIKNQFKKRKVKKIYHAIVSGHIKDNFGSVYKPIGRSPSDFRRRLAGRGARGELREALTAYKVLKKYEDESGRKFTYLEVMPKTGRTHQIRVHMKYLSKPILCDKLYDPAGFCPENIGRLALHAKEIEFKNLDGSLVKIESKLPALFD